MGKHVDSNYWSTTVAGRRLSRRRALVGGALTAGGATALLAGCGGGSGGESKPAEDLGALVTKSEDSTSRAVTGGIWPTFITTEGLSLDHLSAPRTASTQADMTYS